MDIKLPVAIIDAKTIFIFISPKKAANTRKIIIK